MAQFKLNEIRSVIKIGSYNNEGQIKVKGSFSKRWPRKFRSETFYNGYKNLVQTLNYISF